MNFTRYYIEHCEVVVYHSGETFIEGEYAGEDMSDESVLAWIRRNIV